MDGLTGVLGVGWLTGVGVIVVVLDVSTVDTISRVSSCVCGGTCVGNPWACLNCQAIHEYIRSRFLHAHQQQSAMQIPIAPAIDIAIAMLACIL